MRLYLQVSKSSGLKCFSQVKILSFSICLRKSSSTVLVRVMSASHSLRHFLCSSSFGAGSFHKLAPLCRLHVPQPNTAQFSPGMLINFEQTIKNSTKKITWKPTSNLYNVRRHLDRSICAGSQPRDQGKTTTAVQWHSGYCD